MAAIELNKTLFRERFPQFVDPTAFPNAGLDMQWIVATQFISDVNCGMLNGAARELALQYMLAHLLALGVIIAGGGYTSQAGIVSGATIDKVSITLAPPPFGSDQWKWWLNTTPYGAQLLALLSVQSVGGMYYPGGPPERSAFRKGYGLF